MGWLAFLVVWVESERKEGRRTGGVICLCGFLFVWRDLGRNGAVSGEAYLIVMGDLLRLVSNLIEV